MKKIIILLLLFNFKEAFAQQPINHIPTQFDKFIEQPEIDWAVYMSDTIRFPEINLNEFLRTKLDNDQIKAAIWTYSRSARANDIIYADRKTIKRCYLCSLPAFSDSFNFTTYHENVDTSSCRKFDSLVYNLISLTEIIYIEKGKLKSYIPWIAPKTSVYTGLGLFLGIGDYFSTAFNFVYNFQPTRDDKIIYLGKTTRQVFIDSFQSKDRLKEIYGRNLAEALWTYALDDKLNIFSVKTNKKLTPDQLDRNFLADDPVMFPILDTLGNTIGLEAKAFGSVLEYIKKVEIVQQWYYDETSNIVYNRIPEIILFSLTDWYDNSEVKPLIKIVF
ncbi:MAG: hypothetical protein QM737_00660 [Ferruginibacter sp.]